MPKEKAKKKPTVFLFGAGATAGTFPKDIPTAQQFGKFLYKRRGGLKAFPAIKEAIHHLKPIENDAPDFTLEEIWTAFDFYAKLEKALPNRKPWYKYNESQDIKSAILRVYGKNCDKLAKKAIDWPKNAYTLGQLLGDEVKPGDILVSFNYDTVIERLAIERYRRKLSAADSGCAPLKEEILLSKPHGSVSWEMDRNNRKVTWHKIDGSPLLDSLPENKVGKGCEPLVLGTVPIKSELIREVQCDIPEIFSVVACQWKALLKALIRANTLVIVGYSFPSEDLYGRFMFQEAMRQKKSRLRIQYYELQHKAAELRKEICDIFGCKLATLEYKGPVRSKPSSKRR